MQEYSLKLNFVIYIQDGIFYMSLYCVFLNLSRYMRILFTASCWYWLVLGKKTRWLWNVRISFPKFKYRATFFPGGVLCK